MTAFDCHFSMAAQEGAVRQIGFLWHEIAGSNFDSNSLALGDFVGSGCKKDIIAPLNAATRGAPPVAVFQPSSALLLDPAVCYSYKCYLVLKHVQHWLGAGWQRVRTARSH